MAVFPETSVADQVTVVVPIPYGPAGEGPLIETTEQLSVAVAGVSTTLAVHCPGSVLTLTFGAHVITGTSLSDTIISNVQVSESHRLDAITVTVVVPTGNREPEACEYVITGKG